jgi:hypothetical protein
MALSTRLPSSNSARARHRRCRQFDRSQFIIIIIIIILFTIDCCASSSLLNATLSSSSFLASSSSAPPENIQSSASSVSVSTATATRVSSIDTSRVTSGSSSTSHASCPPSKLIHSLSSDVLPCDCSSSADSPGGWEITCFGGSAAATSRSNQSNRANHTNEGESSSSFEVDRVGSDKHDSFDLLPVAANSEYIDDMSAFRTVPIAFTLKYIPNSLVTVECHERTPSFRPAMFQGNASSFI